MPRYYFHIDDGERLADAEGTELPDLVAVRREATVRAGARLQQNPDELWETLGWRLTVEDERGLILLSINVDPMASPGGLSALPRSGSPPSSAS